MKRTRRKEKKTLCKHMEDSNVIEIVASSRDDNILTEYAVCKTCNGRFETKWCFISGTRYWKAPRVSKKKYPHGFEDAMDSSGDPSEWKSR